MTYTFEMNGQAYRTDAETLSVLRSIMESAKASGDFSAVAAVLIFGQRTGRVVEDR